MTDDFDTGIRWDGVIENLSTGMGDPAFDKSMGYQVTRQAHLTKFDLENLYEAWIPHVCVTAYPKEAVRKWLEIKMGGKTSDRNKISEFDKYQQRIGVAAAFAKADTWARLYGGSAIVIIAEDGQPFDKPMKPSSLKTIRSLKVLDRYRIRPVLEYRLLTEDPEFYELIMPGQLDLQFKKMLGQSGGTGTRVHKSRIIRFDGVEMPPDIMMRNEGWGTSIISLLYDTFTRFEGTDAGVATLVQEASLFIYKMKNLSEMLARADEKGIAQLRQRLAAFRASKSNFKMLVADADKEDVTIVTRTFAGLPDVMDKMLTRIVGAARIPMSVLFGQGPAGLAAQGAGDTEAKVWAKLVQQHQVDAYQKKLRSPNASGLFDLIWQAQDSPTNGKLPEDWSMEWKSLIEETEEERIAKRNSQSQVDRAYFDMKVILPEEIRTSRFEGAEYSTETVLDAKAWEKSQEDPFAGLDGSDPGAMPEEGGMPGEPLPEEEDPFAELPEEEPQGRTDTADRPIEIRSYHGLSLGITHRPGDMRHGRPMECAYAHIRGSYGHAEDGMAYDAYVGSAQSDRLFRVMQLKPDGTLDESKWMLGCESLEQARGLYLKHMPQVLFGGIEEVDWSILDQFRESRVKSFGREFEDVETDIDRADRSDDQSAGVNPSSRQDSKGDPVEALVMRSTKEASGSVVSWVDQIYDWLEAERSDGMSLEEAANRLPGLYPQLSPDGLVQSLETGMKLGDLVGRGEVVEETAD